MFEIRKRYAAVAAAMLVIASILAAPLALPASAAVPVTDVTIELNKTGSEPFNTSDGDDDCVDGNTYDTARTFTDGSAIDDGNNGIGYDGLDTCSDNDVVRLGDSVTYKVEVSNNDSDVDYLTATVSLEPYNASTQLPDPAGTIHQEWIEIPSGCETDPLVVTPVSVLQDLDSDGYNETLYCNLGFAREGTNKVFFPASKVLGASTDGTKATINDSIVGASVSATGISNSAATGNNGTSAPSTDGPVEALVTANFRVNLSKEMVGFSIDKDGNPIWPKLDAKPGPSGEAGYLAEFDLIATYQSGSMIADSPDELVDNDGDGFFYDADYDLLDIFTDDSTGNDAALSAGALLYDWDATYTPCSFNGAHGPGASVNCTQTNYPFDWTGPTFTPDGTNDPNFHIDLDNVDTRDPDGDSDLFDVRIGIWIPKADVDSHQTCSGGGSCQYFHINEAQNLDTTSNTPGVFSPVSTEDAAGNNLDNYGTGTEPGGIGHPDQSTSNSDNITNGLLQVSSPGSWTYRKSFQRTTDNTTYYPKIADQLRAKNELLPVDLSIYDYRRIDGGISQICDKIDTTQYEFAGVPAWDKYPTYAQAGGVINWLYWANPTSPLYVNGGTKNNPSGIVWGGGANERYFFDAAPTTQSLYSAVPNGSGSLADLDTELCDDDVNGDGTVAIQLADGSIVDSSGAPSAGAIDWYEDHTAVPAGVGGYSGVTKIRFEYTHDDPNIATMTGAPDFKYVNVGQLYELRVRPDATGYGPKAYMPNYADARRTNNTDNNAWYAWQDNAGDDVQDPASVSFGYNLLSADRNILVPSGISVAKETVPTGIKVVRGGDIVSFQIEPSVFGLWTGTQTGTVNDDLPAGTTYIAGSEEFSVDGGATWLDHAAYLASNPAVTLTSSPTPNAQDPINWTFGSLDAGDQMPLIRYKVLVDPALTSGNFTNTVTFTSPEIAADIFTIDTDDDDVNDTGDGVGDPVRATYTLTILPKFGFDVLKQTSQEVYSTDDPFTFDLTYKNLGGESYSGGEFIDILPFNGDATAVVIGGKNSVRDPATDYNGYYELTQVDFSNGETFWVTDVAPTGLNLDPCASSNKPAGYVPAVGDICHQDYINNGNLLPDGVAAGTFSANWQACTATGSPLVIASSCPIAPIDVTALRFEAPSVPNNGGKTVSLTLDPTGNIGGDPVYTTDANGVQVVDWANSPAIGDIYTNSFGGRIPEISLNVISNDVSVTPVSGTVGDLVWWDYNDDGVVNGTDVPIAGQTLQIFDSNGPLYIDSATGAVIAAADRVAYEAEMGVTLVPYTTTTDTAGIYEFENLPTGKYRIDVINPLSIQTYDLDDGLAANNDSSLFGLALETDPVTGNITDVEDRDDVDFGYRLRTFDVELDKELLTTGPYILGQEVEFRVTVVNNGPDDAPDVEVTDTPTGLTYVSGSEVASTGTYTNPVWDVGQLTSGQTENITIKYTISAAAITDPVFNFAEITDDGSNDFGSDIDSQPGDNTSGDDADDPEADPDLTSGQDTHDDEAGVPLTIVASPSIKIIKTAGTADDGDLYINDPEGTVTFTFVVENDGGTDLTNITITDDAGTPTDTADDVTLSDTECSGLAGPLAPTGTVTCTLDLPVNNEDSPYNNSASTTGTPVDDDGNPYPGMENPTDGDDADVMVPPGIDIVKTAATTADGETYVINANGTVTFTFAVINTGGTHLSNIVIVDNAATSGDTTDDVTLTSAECPALAGPLAPDDAITCTLEMEVDTPTYVNTASTSGDPTNEDGEEYTDATGDPLFEDPTDDDDATTLYPGISIVKTAGDAADKQIYSSPAPGMVTFTYAVTNIGGTHLTGATIADDAGTPADPADDVVLTSTECADLAGPIAPGITVTCTADLPVDLTNSPYSNSAGTTGTPSDENGDAYEGVALPTDDDPSTVVLPPAIDVVKTAGTAADGTPFAISEPGLVTFTYVVANTGGTFISNATITDNAGTPSDLTDDVTLTSLECPGLAGPIAPGDSVTCTTELFVDTATYINGASTIGEPTDDNGDEYTDENGDPLFEDPTDDDDATTLYPGIAIVKTAGDATDGAIHSSPTPGLVTFTYAVTNTGGTHLTNATIVDDAGTPGDITDDLTLTSAECAALAGPVAPGDTVTCTADLPVDLTNSPYSNGAATTATPANEDGDVYEGVAPPTDDDPSTVVLPPAIDIVKTAGTAADGSPFIINGPGLVPFTYVVTNTGGTYISNASIVDNAGTATDPTDDVTLTDLDCPDLTGPIAPGDSVTCTTELYVEGADYVNGASTSGEPTDANGEPYTDQNGEPLFDDPTDDDEAETLTPGIAIVKTAGDASDGGIYFGSEPGLVTFTYDVTNTGGTFLTNATIVDNAGTPSDPTDDLTLTSAECPALAGPIASGDTVTCTADLPVEFANLPYENTASTTASPTDENGDSYTDENGEPYSGIEDPVDDDPSEVVLPPAISIVKTAGNAANDTDFAIAGPGPVPFTFFVTNSGGTFLIDVTITDDAGTPGDPSDDVTLTAADCPELAGPIAPGESVTCTLTLDVDGPNYINQAGTQGTPTDANGDEYTDADGEPLFENPTDTDDAQTLTPGIAIIKTAGDAANNETYASPGPGLVTFTYGVTNTGGSYLSDATITDDAGTPSDPSDDVTLTSAECADLAGPIAPGTTVVCTADLPVDLSNTPYQNTAATTAHPTDENGDTYVDENGEPFTNVEDPVDDDPSVVVLPPAISIIKTAGNAANDTDFAIAGPGPVPFTFFVTNSGGTYLVDVTITDDAGTPSDPSDDVTLTAADCPELAGPIAPGESVTCTLTLDVDGPNYINQAGTQGTPTDANGDEYTDADGEPLFENPTDTDDAETLTPGVAIVKTAGDTADNGTHVSPGPGLVTFTYGVTNTGGSYLSDATITDDAGTPSDPSDDVTLTSAECADLAGPIAPGTTVVCTADLPVDLSNTPYQNTAATTAHPTDENGDELIDENGELFPGINDPGDSDPALVILPPAIDLVKTAGSAGDGADFAISGPGTVQFTYVVANTGGTYISNASIVDNAGTPDDTSDDLTLTDADCPELAGPIAPGDSVTCTAELFVDGPTYVNGASTTGDPTDANGDSYTDANGNAILDKVSDENDAVVLSPSIQIVKVAGDAPDGETLLSGDEIIPFTYTVTNTGGTHLSNALITDDAGTEDPSDDVLLTSTECPDLAGPIAPGDSVVCELELAVTAQPYLNNAGTTATPTDENGTEFLDQNGQPYLVPPTDNDDASVNYPGMKLVKTAGTAEDDGTEVGVDGMTMFTYAIVNTGGTYLANLTITDDNGTPSDTSDDVELTSSQCPALAGPVAPGAQISCQMELPVSTFSGVYSNSAGTTAIPTTEDGTPIEGLDPLVAIDDAIVDNDTDGDGIPDRLEVPEPILAFTGSSIRLLTILALLTMAAGALVLGTRRRLSV